MKRRVIACVDLDYFYAQAEEIRRPEIKGKPVVVCVLSGRGEDSGAVATCNYEARGYGVRAGMPLFRAKTMLRGIDAVFLRMDKDYYQSLSSCVMSILSDIVKDVEIASIDEAYMDLTHVVSDFEHVRDYVAELKRRIKSETGLSCSVGVGHNKVIAKMAADTCKPNGLLIVKPDEAREWMASKPVKELPYVGRKTSEKLRQLGISTIGELATLDPQILVSEFGEKMGTYLHLASNAEYDEPLSNLDEVGQMSRIITLGRDSRDVDEIMGALAKPILELHKKLLDGKLNHKGISVIGITTNFQLISRSRTLERPNDDVNVIKRVASQLFSKMLDEIPDKKLRRVGIKLYMLQSLRGQKLLSEY